MPVHDYVRYFPFPKIRDEQRKAIEFALDAFEAGKKYVMLEMGTGTGKSATGITIARYLEAHGPKTVDDEGVTTVGAYVLTTQKVLQQQYIDDFGPGVGPEKNLLRSIKSASNFTCGFYKDQSCAESRRVLHQLRKQLAGSEFQKSCTGNCGYAKEKQEFIDSPIGITNFSYFLAETMYGKKLTPRSTLIIDECHNTELELGKFIEVTFSEKFARDILKCKLPRSTDQASIYAWITKTYKSKLVKYIKTLENLISSRFASDAIGAGEHSKQYEMLDKHICKINRFIEVYSEENWVMNLVHPGPSNKRAGLKFEFKPVDVARYSHEHLFRFGGHVLLMSATVVDKDTFCRSVGIDTNEVAFLNIPSPFSSENRPIHFISAGSMSKDNIASTLPAIAEAVKMILDQHPSDKGIIHCTNYKVAQYIKENVKSPRLLSHTSENRDSVLKSHMATTAPTVLLSPSMMEGVDLADDASRFQILCKVPFPYLGDEVVKKRMSRDRSWYTYQTVKSIVQSMGRSIRNETDHAVSYILDADWERFYNMNKKMFPEEFTKALVR